MRSHKLRYLLAGVLLFAMSWLGYWIGYISWNENPSKDVHKVQGPPGAPLKDPQPVPLEELDPNKINQIKAWNDQKPKDPRKAELPRNKHPDPPLESFDDFHPVVLPKPQEVNGEEDNLFKKMQKPLKPDGTFYMLLHSGRASKIPGNIHERLQSMPDSVPRKAYVLISSRLPADQRLRPSIGNGHLATMVHSKEVFMNGLYSGYREQSHRAVIPSTCSFTISDTEPPSEYKRQYKLNLGEGIYSEVSRSKSYTLTQRVYAHRNITQLLVVEVDLIRTNVSQPIKLKVRLNRWETSYDMTFTSEDSNMEEVSYKLGRINAPEAKLGDLKAMTQVHVFYDHVPEELAPPVGAARTKWVFLTAIASDKDTALQAYKDGTKLLHRGDRLYAQHVEAWSKLWRGGRIDIEGNLTIARAVYSCLYYTLSSIPVEEDPLWPFVGLSPSGLPLGEHEQNYQGHVLWDQEMWMFPPVLFLHSDLARKLLQTRERIMPAASKAALKAGTTNAYKFPAESGFTGEEISPRPHPDKKIYVSSMISHAALQYMFATNDTASLESSLGQLLAGIGHFMVSQLRHDPLTKTYKIYNISAPDSPADRPLVNNSVFVNVAAKEALEAHAAAFRMAGKYVTQFEHFAEGVFVPFDTNSLYHPAYDGFTSKARLKQPGAVYAGYPLNTPRVDQIRRMDLETYQSVTIPTGPIMPWNMMVIGWLEVRDKVTADTLFKKNFGYIQNEFQVWTETNIRAENLDHASNHLSGMGSFLQTIIAGYGGFRFYENRLEFNPELPPGVTNVLYTGVDYLGSSLDFAVADDAVLVRLVSWRQGAPSLTVYVHMPEQIHVLSPGAQAVRIPRVRTTVAASHVKLFIPRY